MTSIPSDRRDDEHLAEYRTVPRPMARLLSHLVGLAGANLLVGGVALWGAQFVAPLASWSVTLPTFLLLLLAGGLLMLIGVQLLARAGRFDIERAPPDGRKWARLLFVRRLEPTGDHSPPPEPAGSNEPHRLSAPDQLTPDFVRKRRFN